MVAEGTYDTRLGSRGCSFLSEGKKDNEVVKNAFQWQHSASGKLAPWRDKFRVQNSVKLLLTRVL